MINPSIRPGDVLYDSGLAFSTVQDGGVMHNPSIGEERVFELDGVTYRELVRQSYQNMTISAGELVDGVVEGHERNTVYLRFEREDGDYTHVDLTDDEMAAVAWVCSGTLWTRLRYGNED